MRRLMLALCAELTAASPALAAPPIRACDVKLNVADQDPAGLNVRDAPDGKVIGALQEKNAWVQVHVTGDAGGWMRIDGAILYDDSLPDGEKSLSPGVGYVFASKLGVESLDSGAQVLSEPRQGAKLLLTAPLDTDKSPTVEVLGCDGVYIEVRVGKITGWTAGFCANQYTTCV